MPWGVVHVRTIIVSRRYDADDKSDHSCCVCPSNVLIFAMAVVKVSGGLQRCSKCGVKGWKIVMPSSVVHLLIAV